MTVSSTCLKHCLSLRSPRNAPSRQKREVFSFQLRPQGVHVGSRRSFVQLQMHLFEMSGKRRKLGDGRRSSLQPPSRRLSIIEDSEGTSGADLSPGRNTESRGQHGRRSRCGLHEVCARKCPALPDMARQSEV